MPDPLHLLTLSSAAFAAEPNASAGTSASHDPIPLVLALVGIAGGVFNFFYTRSVTRTNRRNDINRANFGTWILSPAETQLAELEGVVRDIKAAFLDRDRDRRRGEVSKIVENKLRPSSYSLLSILQRADAWDEVNGDNWAEDVEARFEAVWDAIAKICSPTSTDPQMEDGCSDSAERLESICADLRNRFSEEAKRWA